MAERDPSELDLVAAFRAYLENAPTEVRPAELARHFAVAYPHGRTALARWGFGRTPAFAWILLLAGLLLALVVGGLVVGTWRRDQAVVVVPRTPAALTGSMSTARDHHAATLLSDGRVLVVGGMDGAAALATAEIYDPKTGTFGATGSMTTARDGPMATLLSDGRVLVVGGSGRAAELYDPGTGTFAPTGSMTTARDAYSATLLSDGRVLVVGGMDDAGTHATAEIYDPTTGTFSPTGWMTTARDRYTLTLLPDGRVLVVGGSPGGYDGSAAGYVWLALDTAELYDPMTGTFAPTGSMTTARYSSTATLLRDGRVLVAGGYEESKDGLATAELYDPKTGTFSPTGPMTTGRGSATALLLPDGRVLVAGGHAANTIWAEVFSAETYEPMTGTFAPTGPMATNRINFTVTLLPDGRVLRAGGFDGGSRYLASADIFTP